MNFSSMLNKLKRDAEAAATANTPSTTTTTTTTSSSTSSSSPTAPPTKRSRTSSSSPSPPFPSTPVKTIYLICPPNVQTGGPEAMHQLCHMINLDNNNNNNNNNIKAKMLYMRESHGEVHHDPHARILDCYRHYNAPSSPFYPGEEEEQHQHHDDNDGVNDNNDSYYTSSTTKKKQQQVYTSDLVIWPECWTHYIDTLPSSSSSSFKQQQHQTAIWWLSVNNNNSRFTPSNFTFRTDILHLYQSEYARQYLLSHLTTNSSSSSSSSSSQNKQQQHHQVLCMTEFIHQNCSSNTFVVGKGQERDLEVLYNPAKGIHYTDEIRKRSCCSGGKNNNKKKGGGGGGGGGGGICFTPIGGGVHGNERLGPLEVTALLHRAKIYIDFGPHPGMDRLPREAALANCLVITNTLGAAQYKEDVPIPDQYKIKKFDVDAIHRLLKSCLEDYETRVKDFDSYRDWIGGQEKRMRQCVDSFLKSIGSEREEEAGRRKSQTGYC